MGITGVGLYGGYYRERLASTRDGAQQRDTAVQQRGLTVTVGSKACIVRGSGKQGVWMTFVLRQAFLGGQSPRVKEESRQQSIEEQYLKLRVF